MLDFLFPADQDAEDISWSDENIRVGVTWAAWQFALKSGVTLWCGSCRGFEVGVIHDQYGESLQVRVRLSETVLIAGFGSVDAALEALPCRMWLRTAADEKSTMQKTVTAALRQAEGESRRFDALRQEYEKAPDVTRQRLYYETMEEILAASKDKTLLDSGVSGKVLPHMPLPGTPAFGVLPSEKK